MSTDTRVVTFKLTPVPPDTVLASKEAVTPLIEDALREAGYEELLTKGHIQADAERTFPVDAVITITVTLLSKIAYDVFKDVVLPKLRRRFSVEEKIEG